MMGQAQAPSKIIQMYTQNIMWQKVVRWYGTVQKWTKPLNESKLLAGILIVLINLSSKLVDVRLSRPLEAYFRHTFSRHALVFAMAWMPTRDVVLALVVSVVAIFVIDHLANDNSPLCALTESFTGTHLEKEKERLEKERKDKLEQEQEMNKNASNTNGNGGNLGGITQDDIDKAIAVMDRMRAIASGTPFLSVPTAVPAAVAPISEKKSGESTIRAANMGGAFSW
jgi:hypothetical protein